MQDIFSFPLNFSGFNIRFLCGIPIIKNRIPNLRYVSSIRITSQLIKAYQDFPRVSGKKKKNGFKECRFARIAPSVGSPQRNERKGVLTGLEFQKITKGLAFSYKTPSKTFIREITSLTKKSGRWTDDEPEVGLPVTYLSARDTYDSIEEAKRFSKLQLLSKTTDVVDALKLVDSRLVNLLVIATEKGSAIYGDIQTGHFSPIPLMGDGMVRVLSIALSLTTSTGGVMLLDEVENGIYYEVMPKIWKMIANTARKLNVQLFVTTHSEECIHAVYQALEELEFLDDLRFYRFEQLKGNTGVVCYDSNEINAALKADIEVR